MHIVPAKSPKKDQRWQRLRETPTIDLRFSLNIKSQAFAVRKQEEVEANHISVTDTDCLAASNLACVKSIFQDCCGKQLDLRNLAFTSSYVNLNVSEAKQMIGADPSLVILDIRILKEYASGHVENATLIPATGLVDRLVELNKEKNSRSIDISACPRF